MSACLLIAGQKLVLAGAAFTLSWTHSVEKTSWEERWAVSAGSLVLHEASVMGSGAGMEPGENARLENGRWVWTPDLAPVPYLLLAASGATGGAWRLCHEKGCINLGKRSGEPIRIQPCEGY